MYRHCMRILQGKQNQEGNKNKQMSLLMMGIRRNCVSLIMYFNIFKPFAIGRSTSVSMMSIFGPSALRASITCLAVLTEVTVGNRHPTSIKEMRMPSGIPRATETNKETPKKGWRR